MLCSRIRAIHDGFVIGTLGSVKIDLISSDGDEIFFGDGTGVGRYIVSESDRTHETRRRDYSGIWE